MKHFGVDLGGVIDLLSRHIYSGPEVYLREVLQNSRDALVARADGDAIDPAWRIRLTPADVSADGAFHISDDGIGLTAGEVEDLIATVGRSSKRDVFDLRNQDFLGHFGIGLLSCFMVADRIDIVSRKAQHPPVRWVGRADGTFTVTEVDEDIAVGTTVSLTPVRERAHLVGRAEVVRQARRFAEFLPVPVEVATPDRGTDNVTHAPPFLLDPLRDRDAILNYGEEVLGTRPFDAFPIDVPGTATRGVGYVLAQPPAGGHGARVYLGRMLLAEREEHAVPEWAFFVRPVITSDALTPTASRESLVRDEALATTVTGIADAVRAWIEGLAAHEPHRLAEFVRAHERALRTAALEDDALMRIVGRHFPYDTTAGPLTVDALAARGAIEYANTVDEYRLLAGIHGPGRVIVNGGYTDHAEVLRRMAHLFADVAVTELDVMDSLHALADPPLADRDRTQSLEDRASAALAVVDTDAVVKVLEDETMPAVYLADAAVLERVERERAQDVATGAWASALRTVGERVDEALARTGRTDTRAKVCLNWRHPLVQRLAQLRDDQVFERSVRLVYVQSLLSGRRPLTERDRTLMSDSLDDLITLSVGLGDA